MRFVLACLMIAAAPALAQAPATKAPAPAATSPPPAQFEMPVRNKYAAPRGSCGDCAEVRSVRQVTKEVKQDEITQGNPSGLVASIPLGGGKAKVGSSNAHGPEAVRTSTQWEVTLRYDDGRYRLMMLDKQPEFGEGDRVRVDSRGQVLPP
jgi:hypothetical protein